MKIDFLVCGRFHYLNYYRFISDYVDKRIFLSDRVSFFRKELDVINFPLKEYLIQFIYKLGLQAFIQQQLPLLHRLWSKSVVNYSGERRNVAIILMHGSFLNYTNELRSRYDFLIFEAVNAHPFLLDRLFDRAKNDAKYFDFIYPENRKGILEEISIADGFIFPSRFCFESYLPYLSLRQRNNSKIIPYPLKIDSQSAVNVNYRHLSIPIKVVFVGQITLRKGVFYLLEAMECLELMGVKNRFTFDFYGAADIKYLRLLRQRFGDFNYHGHKRKSTIVEILNSSHVLCLPSIEDGFGLVVAEALSLGNRVIVSRTAGASELINTETNFIVDPCSSRQIVDALLLLLEASTNSNQLSAQSNPSSSSSLGFQDALDSWSDYASVLESHVKALCEVECPTSNESH